MILPPLVFLGISKLSCSVCSRHAPMHRLEHALSYFASAVSSASKMFMKLTPGRVLHRQGVCIRSHNTSSSALLKNGPKKLERLFFTSLSSLLRCNALTYRARSWVGKKRKKCCEYGTWSCPASSLRLSVEDVFKLFSSSMELRINKLECLSLSGRVLLGASVAKYEHAWQNTNQWV
jgi:hypothetical protein